MDREIGRKKVSAAGGVLLIFHDGDAALVFISGTSDAGRRRLFQLSS